MKFSRKTRSLGRNKRHLRVRKRISGTNDRPRVSLYRSNKNIYLQLIDDSKGITLSSLSSLKTESISINKDIAIDEFNDKSIHCFTEFCS